MNNESLIMVRFYRLANIVRDCLELALNEKEINKELLTARGEFYYQVLNDEMINDLLKRSQEGGEQLKQHLQTLYDDVYVTKRYININNNVYTADISSRLKLLDYIVGLYQSVTDLLTQLHDDLAKKAPIDPLVVELLENENVFYRVLIMLAIFNYIVVLNNELQTELSQNGRKLTPQTNFTLEELKKLVGFLRFAKEKYTGKNEIVQSIFDQVTLTIKMLDGSIKTNDVNEIVAKVDETRKNCIKNIIELQNIWADNFNQIYKIINEQLKNNANRPLN